MTVPSRLHGLLRRIREERATKSHGRSLKAIDDVFCSLLCISPTLPRITWRTGLVLDAFGARCLLQEAGILDPDPSRPSADRVSSMISLLPLLVGFEERIRLAKGCLRECEMMELVTSLGPLYGPLFGNPTGHYKLDLAELFDRKAAICLVEINNAEVFFGRSESGRSDTSQSQNWANFRNATYLGKSILLEAGFFHSTPKSGVLEFDFVSTTRPPISTTPMKKYEFDIVMRQVDLRPKSSFVRTPLAGGRLVDPHYTAHFAAFQQIRVAMCDRWLSTEQMVVILRRFEKFVQAGQPHGAAPNQNHSHDKDTEADAHAHAKKMQQYMKFQRSTTRISIKIQLFTYLFGRLVDIYNLSHVFAALTDEEECQCLHRLGWLNCYNPLQPIRRYALDLSQPEEREIVKILTVLDMEETARFFLERGNDREYEVWLNGEFIYVDEKVEPARGWDLRILRMKWQRDEKYIPHEGFLSLAFNDEFCYEDARKGQVPNCLCGQRACARLGAQNPTDEELTVDAATLNEFLEAERQAYRAEMEAEQRLATQRVQQQQSLRSGSPSGHAGQRQARQQLQQQPILMPQPGGAMKSSSEASAQRQSRQEAEVEKKPQQEHRQPQPGGAMKSSSEASAQMQSRQEAEVEKKPQQPVKLAPLQGKPNLVPFSEQEPI